MGVEVDADGDKPGECRVQRQRYCDVVTEIDIDQRLYQLTRQQSGHPRSLDGHCRRHSESRVERDTGIVA